MTHVELSAVIPPDSVAVAAADGVSWQIMVNNRRRQKRVAADAPANIAVGDGEAVRGSLANVSDDGLFLKADINPGLHREVHVHFILRPEHAVCNASGKITWQAPHGVGIVLDSANDSYREFVQALITADQSILPEPKRQVLERILGDIDVEII